MEWGRAPETDSGWVGAGPDDDLDQRLAAEETADFDRTGPHVMTALGPIDPGALGVTLVGGALMRGADEPAGDAAIVERYAALAALDDAYAAGARTVVALADPAGGIDLPAIGWLAERTAVHLIAPATIAPGLDRDEAADRLVADLVDGMAGTSIRAGAISLHFEDADASPDLAAAAAVAQRRTGAPVLVGGADEQPGETIRCLEDAGIEPRRVTLVVSGCGCRAGTLLPALARGASIALVDLLADGWEMAADHAALVAALTSAGYGDRVLLGAGSARRSDRRAAEGGHGWSGVLERFPLLLMDAGVAAMAVRAMLVDNPRRALTIESPAGSEGTG